MVIVSALTNPFAYLEKSMLKCVDSDIGKSNLKFEICYIILRKTILFLTFILPLMNDYAAMHYTADERCFALINQLDRLVDR